MNSSSFRRTTPLTLAIAAILIVMIAACGATPTPTAVPPTATKAAPAVTTAAAPAATTAPAQAAPTATKAAVAPAASTVSFAKDVLPIFQKNCTKCHSGSSPRAGLSWENYAAAMKGSSNGSVVTAGSPDKSPVYILVKSGVMPFGGPKLSDADAQKIFDWIQAGALNN